MPRNDDPNADDILGVGPDPPDGAGRPPDVHLDRVHRAGAWTARCSPSSPAPRSTAWSSTAQVARRASACPALAASTHPRTDAADSTAAPRSAASGRPTELRCSGDVIVCGGHDRLAAAAAAVRHRPGRRPAARSASRCAPTCPGVGANLHDHALATILYESARKIPEGKANNLEAHFFAHERPGHDRAGPAAADVALPDAGRGLPGQLDYGDGYAIVAGIIRPLSRGRLWLRSADPAEHPVDRPALPRGAGRRAGAARRLQAVPRGRRGPGAEGLPGPRDRARPRRAHRRGPRSSTACGT